MRVRVCALALAGLLSSPAATQAQDQSPSPSWLGVATIAHTTEAVDYRSGAEAGFSLLGTDLMPEASGKAKVISKPGLTDVHLDLDSLRLPETLDSEFLTCVLWAISETQRPQAEQAEQQAQIEAQQRVVAEKELQQTGQPADTARQKVPDAQQRAQSAETQQQQLRQQLRDQLNRILQTQDTARGLIVRMPDVLFDTGSAALTPTARERLAKVSGILMAHPDLKVEVDGYTDSTGDRMFNQKLSQDRATSVQDYLTRQGMPSGSVSIHGFGEANPIASNDSAAGKQQNRRVELVVSGESIGNQVAGAP